jgi:penicillin-binding protein 2
MVWQQEHRLIYEDYLERYRIVVFLFIGLFLFLSFRLFYLQVIRGVYYRHLSEQQRTHIVLERAPRGIIYDRNNAVIVGNKSAFVALFYPFAPGSTPTKEVMDHLKKILTVKNLGTAITQGWRSGRAVRLSSDLTRDEMFLLQEQRLVMPGITVVKEARRSYRAPEANSHLVGYLNEITAAELENLAPEGYKPGDWMGRGGLEQMYNSILHGQDGGWQIEVDALGHQTRLVRHIAPVPGNNLRTTIDQKLQEIAGDALQRSPSGRGAVVALDPRSGAVRALVSAPGFDPNLSISREFGHYLLDKKLPLFNRVTQGLYPPGSVFKVITFIAAVVEGGVQPSMSYTCKGSFTLGDRAFKCWLYKKGGHGTLNLIGALANSCDVYFYQLGIKTGPKLIEKYARIFHLGEVTGIEMPSEKKGLVPSPEWKQNKLHEPWTTGDTINIAIGQGPLWISPLQVAFMMAAVANNGIVYQPYIVNTITSPRGEVVYQSRVRKKDEIKLPDEAWRLLHAGLEEVVKNGTGRICQFETLKVAAKTGTAQNPHGNDHSWYVGYAPAENPELVVAVLVENGGSGASVAGPIARDMFKSYFNLNNNDQADKRRLETEIERMH